MFIVSTAAQESSRSMPLGLFEGANKLNSMAVLKDTARTITISSTRTSVRTPSRAKFRSWRSAMKPAKPRGASSSGQPNHHSPRLTRSGRISCRTQFTTTAPSRK